MEFVAESLRMFPLRRVRTAKFPSYPRPGSMYSRQCPESPDCLRPCRIDLGVVRSDVKIGLRIFSLSQNGCVQRSLLSKNTFWPRELPAVSQSSS